MSPVRPVFSDGAILAAADLTVLGQLDRDRDARHARHLHTPGVAAGLELATVKRVTDSNAAYVDVTLRPGYAVDGSGRELVVGTSMPVSPDRFAADNPSLVIDKERAGGTTTVSYPVFIRGLDSPLVASDGRQLGCQAATGPTRIAEDVEIEFGRPGDARVEQEVPPPDAGPGDGAWRVLVGFVRYDKGSGRFVEVATTADGVSVATAGVHAGVVAGHHGRIEIRPGAGSAPGSPTIVLDERDGGSIVFGLRTGTGTVSPLLTVDASGNLSVTGTLGGRQTSGSVLVASGTAFDGTVLPLPAGVEASAVASGAVQLTVLLTPRHPPPRPLPRDEGPSLPSAPLDPRRVIAAECRVDPERRLHCWGTRFTPGDYNASATEVSCACDYVLLASVPKGGA
jgi:hypothetical protein